MPVLEPLLTKRLRHRCFPVRFAKFLRTPILKIICEGLLLSVRVLNAVRKIFAEAAAQKCSTKKVFLKIS